MKEFFFSIVVFLLVGQSASAALKVNDSAPDFVLRDGSNREVSLADLTGRAVPGKGRGVVLSFFASWCIPCRNELPLLNAMVQELRASGVSVALVGVREDFETIDGLLKELHVDKPVVLSDQSGSISERYQVRFLPVTFFIAGDGKVKDMIFGEIKNAAELRKSAEKLMK